MKNNDERLINFWEELKQYRKDIPDLIHLWRLGVGAVYAIENVNWEDLSQQNSNNGYVIETETVIKQIDEGEEANKPDPKWLNGFYFNAAIMRIDAFYERTLRTLVEKCEQSKEVCRVIKNINIGVLKELMKERFSTISSIDFQALDKIRKKVNNLKHDIKGYPLEKMLTQSDVFEAFKELTNLLKNEDVKEYLKQTYKDNG